MNWDVSLMDWSYYVYTEKKMLLNQKHAYHGFKSICYRISNIFIGSCSIFLWINSMHAFGKKSFWFNSIFFSVYKITSVIFNSNEIMFILIIYMLFHPIPCRNCLIWSEFAMRARWGWPLGAVVRKILRFWWGPERDSWKIVATPSTLVLWTP